MSVCLDRFSCGIPDPQDEGVFAECEGCGGEIYFGENYYEVKTPAGVVICHATHDCLETAVHAEVLTAGE